MCTHTVLANRAYSITDGTRDPRHADNPFLAMTRLRSYLGVPLIGEGGHTLGAHCVIDVRPRVFTEVDTAALTEAAEKAMRLLDAYRLH